MDFKILCPKFIPKFRLIDLPKSNHHPVDKPFITPPPPYMLNSVDYPTEGALIAAAREKCKVVSAEHVRIASTEVI